jgi:bifunctional non-homologous end joining protein LigD
LAAPRALDEAGQRRLPAPLDGHASDVIRLLERERLEGIVAKRLDRPYTPGRRSKDWAKLKLRRSESFLVTGWSPSDARVRDP